MTMPYDDVAFGLNIGIVKLLPGTKFLKIENYLEVIVHSSEWNEYYNEPWDAIACHYDCSNGQCNLSQEVCCTVNQTIIYCCNVR